MSNVSSLDGQPEAFGGPQSANEHETYDSYQQILPLEGLEFSQGQMVQLATDFPMNWLPPDPSLAIDYDNIVGLGVGSLDFFALPNTSDDVSNIQNDVQQEPTGMKSATGQLHLNGTVRRDTRISLATRPGTPWNSSSPGTAESYVSSASPFSAAHTLSPSDAPGGLYATSVNGARMPCTIRARRANRLIPGAKPIRRLNQLQYDKLYEQVRGMSFPDTSHVAIDTFNPASDSMNVAPILSNLAHKDMLQSFNKLCLNDSSIFPLYTSSRFPSITSLNMCIRLYFENFDAVMPILHNEINQINDNWILALAVSAIGCQYAEADEYAQMVEPMHEFLRRAISVTINTENIETIGQHRHRIAFSQAMVLSQVGMLYSGSSRLFHFARTQHSAMIELARVLVLPVPTSTLQSLQDDNDRSSSDLAWKNMLLDECKRRICYSIWLLDCMAVYHFQQQLLMPPDMMFLPLPNDKLWQSKNATDWCIQPSLTRDTPSLSSATILLFREKKVMAELGQFSRVILLHSVYREIFQMKNCFARPFGNWVPSNQHQANTKSDESLPNLASSGSGGKGVLNSWRNAALDCVDALHWAANGTIALQAGAEHPTVLHLHLSRTILLAPLDKFQTLTSSVVSFSQISNSVTLDTARRQTALDAERDILEWAQRDQCKARLAVLHSGCLFWHIRRYSCRAFYEPMAVFLATLTIWAYSSYASRTASSFQDPTNGSGNDIATQPLQRNNHSDGDAPHSPPDEDTEQAPTFIHLDRPNDDEMVQTFVRFGTASTMRANIAGVGDIYSTDGPARILKEGRKILETISTAWGRTDRFSSVLEVLEQVASGRMTLGSEQDPGTSS